MLAMHEGVNTSPHFIFFNTVVRLSAALHATHFEQCVVGAALAAASHAAEFEQRGDDAGVGQRADVAQLVLLPARNLPRFTRVPIGWVFGWVLGRGAAAPSCGRGPSAHHARAQSGMQLPRTARQATRAHATLKTPPTASPFEGCGA